MSLLAGFRVVEIGEGLAAAVCGRLFADVGVDPAGALSAADLIVCEGRPQDLRAQGCDTAGLRRLNPKAVLVLISPFGQTGPQAKNPATDLTLFFASGM